MRTRKARGKKPALVTLTEPELVAAAREYLEKRGVKNQGRTSYIKFTYPKGADSSVRCKVEVCVELESG